MACLWLAKKWRWREGGMVGNQLRESIMLAMFKTMFTLSTKLLTSWSETLFPRTCPLCGSLDESYICDPTTQQGCCAKCKQSIQVISKLACKQCGKPLPASLSPGPCGRCLRKPLPQHETISLFAYKGAVRDALLAWKLQGDSRALDWLLDVAKPVIADIFDKHDVLIPVPMPLARMRKSGLHHSADLSLKIAAMVGCKVNWQILRRSPEQQTQSFRQSALSGLARQRNLRKAFVLANDYTTKLEAIESNVKFWVIDDILTTGATLRHASLTLSRTKHAVFAFSFARAIRN